MREQLNKLEASKIDSICTRFYYTNIQRIHYRMVIHYTGNTMYKDFDSYQEYKQNYDMLVRAIHDNSIIPNNFRAIRSDSYLEVS